MLMILGAKRVGRSNLMKVIEEALRSGVDMPTVESEEEQTKRLQAESRKIVMEALKKRQFNIENNLTR